VCNRTIWPCAAENVEKVPAARKGLTTLSQFIIVGASEAVNIGVRERLVNVHVRTRKAFLQKIADREKIMESAEVLFAVFKGDRVHDKMQMTVCRVHVQGIYDLVPREKMADIVT
jgi:hypothetical protein